MRTLVIVSVKDEGPWIVEWVAYHRALGFSDIIICQNDSTDGTHDILRRLEETGEILYVDNTGFTGTPQLAAYRKALDTPLYQKCDWCLCLDIDEYFVPRHHDSVTDFLKAYPNADAIALNWLNFGSGGEKYWRPGLLMDRFLRCAEADSKKNLYFKSFHRPSAGYTGLGPHRPHGPSRDTYIYADGTVVPEIVQKGGQPDHIDHSEAQINHYSVRSREEFLRKQTRGDGFFSLRGYDPKKFVNFDTNESSDDAISRFRRKTVLEFCRLMSDGPLASLHYKSCLHHFSRPLPEGEAGLQAVEGQTASQ